jgi:hypothetical protein
MLGATSKKELNGRQMNRLEKILFLEITNKQFSRFPDREYMVAYNTLTEAEKAEFVSLSNEIHKIYNYINSGLVAGAKTISAKSISEYDENINPINPKILIVVSDFDLTLKPELSQKTKDALLALFGQNYLDRYQNSQNY